MAQWIEVKVRYEKLTETGKSVKVTDPYLVDALSCTEAEARVVEEITLFCNDFNVLNVGKTKISEIFWNEGGDKFYKVKVKIVDVYKYKVQEEAQNTAKEVVEKVAADKGVQRAVRNFRNAVPEGTKVSMSVHGADGTIIPETVIVDKSKPKDDDD